MSIYEITDDDSETCESSEDEDESTEDILNFCDRVTKELQSCFRRNLGNEDYCDDVYEDKFETARSGSYSYYADILALAQMSDKADNDLNFRSSGDVLRNGSESRTVYPSNWKCSGQWNPTVGAGPLEELFQVLGHLKPENAYETPTANMQEWSMNQYLPSVCDEEIMGIGSIDSEFSSFIDIFHRWNNDSFTSLPSASDSDFVSHNY